MNRPLASLAAAALALCALDAAAINKCVDRNGKVTYQEAECPKDDKAQTIRPQTGGGPAPEEKEETAETRKPVNPADDDKDDPRMMMTVSTLANYETCSMEPAFNEKHGATFNNWRSRNKENLARLERSVKYQGVLEQMRNQVRTQAVASPDKFTTFCDATFAPAVAKNYAK